ncbi:Arabinose 5-phosphate isomerase KdsD [Daldinia childiae]|uniref:Arabinose 5-phosphate isomerase KdsD n=1 Tax=Daldinia childiae TaxID=326645 RepID=UPI001447E4AB|nr:Arabinose 5-phosphate isomerase KdsD [Daldinia childiae]KAF3058076.1 Arabinose 5-phosphate isomerase KdsD [Daldinia childiae]
MVEHQPVHNSEVYLLGLRPRPTVPPPSPPSPLTPREAESSSTAIEELCLDDTESFEDISETTSLTKQRISGAVHVSKPEATALRSLTHLYRTNTTAIEGFSAAVGAITKHEGERGKLVIIGVGKSGHISKKLVATFNSLGVHATFLHPTEALHGDLGKIGKNDVVLFITFSGKTPELLALLPHLDATLPVIVLTSHTRLEECELIRQRQDAILLPAPIHESEIVSFGVSAPTTSTTVALALGDALAVVASQELHSTVISVFAKNHPGGAIGQAFSSKPHQIRDIIIPLYEIPEWPNSSGEACGADILKLGYDSKSGWARVNDVIASPRRIRRLETAHMAWRISDIPNLVVDRSEWISIRASTRISQAAEWLREPLMSPDCSEAVFSEDSILAAVENGEIIGVLAGSRPSFKLAGVKSGICLVRIFVRYKPADDMIFR